ncbi:MAG: spore coat protein CotH [Bacteroidetes bacterium OLB11]|nr:MAG: spore coat protein CotH [Bacteroidetes bacterium OLB11]
MHENILIFMKKILSLFILLNIGNSLLAQFTTNLPVVIITTSGAIGNTQIQGTMSIIDNASGINNYPNDPSTFSGMIGIKLRGGAAYAKQSYTVETWIQPGVSLDTSLLGMPSDNDWVLLGHYPDRSLLRENLAYILHSNMGRYAPRMKFVELVVNNQYAGIYNFGETIKRNSGRLGLSKLTVNDNYGYNLTGGYIWEINTGNNPDWASAYAPPFAVAGQTIGFDYVYPKSSDIIPVQEAYIKSYVDSFENAMNAANYQDTLLGWRKHGAVNSFIDFILIQEVSKNYYAYRKNNYYYKDKGTKMRPGPLWGFDISFYNTNSCNSSLDTGWAYNLGGACPNESSLAPFWWRKLTTDNLFMSDLKCRYQNFREPDQTLDTTKIFFYIDSMSSYLNQNGAITRNFTQWPIWNTPIVNEPTPMAPDYATEISNLKQYIRKRLIWLDNQWQRPASCFPTGLQNQSLENDITIYPIPTNGLLNVQFNNNHSYATQILLYDMQGKCLYQAINKEQIHSIDVSHFAKGVYFIQVKSNENSLVKKSLLIKIKK